MNGRYDSASPFYDINQETIHDYPQLNAVFFMHSIFEMYDERKGKSVTDLLSEAKAGTDDGLLQQLLSKAKKDWFRTNPCINDTFFLANYSKESQAAYLTERVFYEDENEKLLLSKDNELNYFFIILAHQDLMQAAMPDIETYGFINSEIMDGSIKDVITVEKDNITYTRTVPFIRVRDGETGVVIAESDEPLYELKTTLKVFRNDEGNIQHHFAYTIHVYNEEIRPIFGKIFSPLYSLLSKLPTVRRSIDFSEPDEEAQTLIKFINEFVHSYQGTLEGELVMRIQETLPSYPPWRGMVTLKSRLKLLMMKFAETEYGYYLSALNNAISKKYGYGSISLSFSQILKTGSVRLLTESQSSEETTQSMRHIEETIGDLQNSQDEELIPLPQLVSNVSASIEVPINENTIPQFVSVLSMPTTSNKNLSVYKEALRQQIQNHVRAFFLSICGNTQSTLLEMLDELFIMIHQAEDSTRDFMLFELSKATNSRDLYQFLEIGIEVTAKSTNLCSHLQDRMNADSHDSLLSALDHFKVEVNTKIRRDIQKVNDKINICEKYLVLLKNIIVEEIKNAKEAAHFQAFFDGDEVRVKAVIGEIVDQRALIHLASPELINAAMKYNIIANILLKKLSCSKEGDEKEKEVDAESKEKATINERLQAFDEELKKNTNALNRFFNIKLNETLRELQSQKKSLEEQRSKLRAKALRSEEGDCRNELQELSSQIEKTEKEINTVIKKIDNHKDNLAAQFIYEINNFNKVILQLDAIFECYIAHLVNVISEEMKEYESLSKFYLVRETDHVPIVDLDKIDIEQVINALIYFDLRINRDNISMQDLKEWAVSRPRLLVAVKKYDIIVNKLQNDCLRNEAFQETSGKIAHFQKMFDEFKRILEQQIDSTDKRFLRSIDDLLHGRHFKWKFWSSPEKMFVSEVQKSLHDYGKASSGPSSH